MFTAQNERKYLWYLTASSACNNKGKNWGTHEYAEGLFSVSGNSKNVFGLFVCVPVPE